jgi:tetratricopeptide (TPR) repeat protein
MKIFNFLNKIIVQILFVIIFFSTSQAKPLDKFNKTYSVSDYFSGILSFNENQYEKSFNFLKKLNGLETSHSNYSVKYLYSTINSGDFKEAFKYAKKLEKKKLDNFESHLITGIFYLKNSNLVLAQKYFQKAVNKSSQLILNNYISRSLKIWTNPSNFNLNNTSAKLNDLDDRFENLKKIQNVFLNCYFDSPKTNELFKKLTSNKKTDFSRYNYFYASFAVSSGKVDEAKNILQSALQSYPRNLLLNQFAIDLDKKHNIHKFNCKNISNIIAEILYVTANALSSQSIYSLSNFYLNLAKYLNEDFDSYDTLLAENFFKVENFDKAKEIFNSISKKGDAFKWYSSKQLARIYILEESNDLALKLMKNAYKTLEKKFTYETFDYAEFLKNNEKFEESIPFYTKILNEIEKDHPLYPEATDGRGVAYERINEWEKAEKDLLASLRANPDQAYVINYLAYSWIEQGIKIKESLNMLEKANKLRSNDPYITDSLGWALYKLKRYKEAKDYIQLAVRLMPGDPVVNDHYGDVLWKNGNEIQARYYWEYVMNLEKTEVELKNIVEQKLIKGL